MHIFKIPNEIILINNGVVDKHVVIYDDIVVYVGSESQCKHYINYMEGSEEELLLREWMVLSMN
jgi:hypothetical protein